jgi:hypothetical protein
MCFTCWAEGGKPAILTPKTRLAAELIAAVYGFPDGVCGGNLHIVTDDWNLDDNDIEFCRNAVADKISGRDDDDFASDPEQLKAEAACIGALAELPMAERLSAMALSEGFIEESNED